ncbi:MAG: thioredoxin family protein [Desulfobacteraceae bacterium]|nr:MAG: thioredoxin family protein [Desulfobacteraceae bacterium]
MDDVTQIRIGKHMTGIIGLKPALKEAASSCKGLSDNEIANKLLKFLSRRNYIEDRIKDVYAQAFLREYKKLIGEPVPEAVSHGLQIKVLGMGCPQCDRLELEVMAAMSETGIMGDMEHVRDLAEIGRYGVMGSPALIINNAVKSVGSVPPREKIKSWIQQAAGK